VELQEGLHVVYSVTNSFFMEVGRPSEWFPRIPWYRRNLAAAGDCSLGGHLYCPAAGRLRQSLRKIPVKVPLTDLPTAYPLPTLADPLPTCAYLLYAAVIDCGTKPSTIIIFPEKKLSFRNFSINTCKWLSSCMHQSRELRNR